jgi:hypothetical protein
MNRPSEPAVVIDRNVCVYPSGDVGSTLVFSRTDLSTGKQLPGYGMCHCRRRLLKDDSLKRLNLLCQSRDTILKFHVFFSDCIE